MCKIILVVNYPSNGNCNGRVVSCNFPLTFDPYEVF